MKGKNKWLAAFLVVALIFVPIIWAIAVIGGQSPSEEHAPVKEWRDVKWSCPECGWVGYVGAMKITERWGPDDYYCPVCGFYMECNRVDSIGGYWWVFYDENNTFTGWDKGHT